MFIVKVGYVPQKITQFFIVKPSTEEAMLIGDHIFFAAHFNPLNTDTFLLFLNMQKPNLVHKTNIKGIGVNC